MGAKRGVVRVRREALAACMTCPLCRGLLREATAFAECLHSFCRECIMEKINDEEIESCPVCNTDLGCAPEEKLRPDHNIQDIRNKVFPLKRKKIDASKVSTVTLPVKRKQRSLSSLAVEAPRVATPAGLTGRRRKATRRTTTSRATPSSNNGTMKLPNKSGGRDQKTQKISAPQSTKMMTTVNKKQNNLDIVTSRQPSSEDRKNDKTIDKEELWKPLNSFLEASGTKSLRSSPKSHVAAAKEDKIMSTKGELPIRKDDTVDKVAITGKRVSAHSNKLILQEENNGNSLEPASSKDKRTTEDNLMKSPENDSQQGLLGSTSTGSLHDGITTPVWFSLVTSPNQIEANLLPQLQRNYLRIKDGTLQVSSIQSYIMNKLGLASDDEVEIICHDRPVCPSTTLHDLLDLWLSREPAEQVQAPVGAPAKEFVMVLSYRRRPGARSLCCTMPSPYQPCHCNPL